MKKQRYIVVGAFVAVAGCVLQPRYNGETLSVPEASVLNGYWMGHRGPEQNRLHWGVWRRETGAFDAVFLQCVEGEPLSLWIESGSWGHNEHFYQTRTEVMSNGVDDWALASDDPNATHVYRIISMSQTRFEYENLVTGEQYAVDAVDPGTKLACDVEYTQDDTSR